MSTVDNVPAWLAVARAGDGFTEDVQPEGCLHAAFVRSPLAHARIESIARAVEDMPDVVAVWTADDLPRGIRPIPCIVPLINRDGSSRADPPRTLLARGKVRHQGEAVAMVIARSARAARQAAQAWPVRYAAMPAVTDAVAALEGRSPRVWDELPSNVCFDWETGDACATRDALSGAAHVVELSLRNNRVVVAPLETRNALAWVDSRSGRRVLVSATQGAHWSRDVIARDVLGWDPSTLELVTPRVGGSFGTKIFVYPEQVLVLLAAERLGAPVKWVASREEAFVSDTQGRDHHSSVRLGLDAQGRFLALQVDTNANLGAFLSNYAPFNPTTCGAPVLTGAYRIGAFHARVRGVLTHTPPVDSYRGAGRPEANYVIERAIDAAALRIGIDKAELRRTNLVGPAHLPYTTATGLRLDTGLFADNLERALREADYAGFESRRRASAAEGRLRGIGVVNYLEANGGMALARIMEPGGLPLESARIAFEFGGTRLRVDVGTQSSGQGHRTSYASVVSKALAWEEARVSVHQGRTDRLAQGTGTGGSKSLLSGSTALLEACDAVVAKAQRWAASRWDVPLEAVRWVDGCLDAGARRASLESLVSDAAPGPLSFAPHPFDTEVCATVRAGTYGNGCHVCEVEVDPQTGCVEVIHYLCVNDFGEVVSPRHVRAQVEGGVAQGLGQALYEECRFDPECGAMVATDFDRYSMVQAPQMPRVQVLLNHGSRGSNRLGVKGCGESGASGAPPAVINAVQDALAGAIGERALDVQMPATPTQLWSLLRSEMPIS